MTIEAVIESEFSDQQREEMHAANRRLAKLYRGGALDGWLEFVPALVSIRTAALHAAGTNSTRDRRYGRALVQIMQRLLPGFVDGASIRPEATHLLWLSEEERIEVLAGHRAKLTPAQHAALATPKGARNCVARIIAARDQPGPRPEQPQEQAKAQKPEQPQRGSLEANLLSHFPPQLRNNAEVVTAVTSIVASFDRVNAAHVEHRVQQVFGERAARVKRILQDANRRFPFTRAEFAQLRMAVHPDNSASEQARNLLARLLEERKHLLRPEEDLPPHAPLPVDSHEMQARKRTRR